jgi:hypothetical protein
MRNIFRVKFLASALALGTLPLLCAVPFTSAVADVEIGFTNFHDQLASYGDWVYSDRWGEVWVPGNVPDDFRPYDTKGYWADTDEYGLTWVSDYEWGDIPFHYGRWVNDLDDGWLWIPGYVWSPGWVVWRSNDQYTGWMPMPPDEAFLQGGNDNGSIGVSANYNNPNDYYGYSRWYGRDYDENRFASNWVFIGAGHVADRDYHSYVVNKGTNLTDIIRNTKNITNYSVVNDHVVNHSVDIRQVERISGHPVKVVKATDVMRKPDLITRADTGRQVQARMRQETPHGSGVANSAPKPTPAVVNTLSTHVAEHNGRQPAHLFTQKTVVQGPLAAKPSSTVIAPAAPTGETPAQRAAGSHQGTNPSSATTAPATETPAEHRASMRGQQPKTTGGTTPNVATPPATETAAEHRASMRGEHPNATGGMTPNAATPPATETPAEHRASMRGQQPNATGGTKPDAATAPATETPAEHRASTRGQQPNATGGAAPKAAAGPAAETPAERAARLRKEHEAKQQNGPANNPQ